MGTRRKKSDGAPAIPESPLRSRFSPEEQQILLDVLKKKPVEEFTGEQLANKAMYWAAKDELLTTAILWLAAAHREEDDTTPLGRYHHLERYGRAAHFYATAGRWDLAEPMVEKLLCSPESWPGVDVEGSREQTWAAEHLLGQLYAKGQKEEFEKLLTQMVALGEHMGVPFPKTFRAQEELLDHCHALGLVTLRDHIGGLILRRTKPAPWPLRERVKRYQSGG